MNTKLTPFFFCLFSLNCNLASNFQTKETTGDKNRFILRSLHQSSDSDFDTFLKKLQSTQAHVASRIKAVHAQVILARKTSEKYSEDDFGNDFDPGTLSINIKNNN